MMQSSTLYLGSLVLLSAGCLSVFLTACLAWWRIRGLKDSPSVSLSPTSVNVTGSIFLPASTVNKLGAMVLVLAGLTLGVNLWMIVGRYGRGDLVKLRDVHVLQRYDARHFLMSVRESPAGPWGKFSAVPCQPFPDDIRDGVTLLKFYYVYDPHLNCNDWYAPGAGYSAWRTPDDKPILTDFARSESASPCSAETDGPKETATRTAR